MTGSDRMIALEREVMYTRMAAIRIILRVIDEFGATPQERFRFASQIDELAKESDFATASIAKCVCLSLRRS
ncbi:hypothetical protein KM031_20190 (plasmid) [Gemmobacter fulvus]|uniref:Uncharacterized protein n=1 Tax=Gemmobacter fulvus TaxID=2840474 RepID=A0A975PBH3_9RHOB|nr:hypothetical protein [Gemmobacter fulvus]MBT9247733.1 hypothetical protein [Gemmobacter fulvus]QWK92912.1 hypothetical protein KM031_20190 [Gemmobacter fulvus]